MGATILVHTNDPLPRMGTRKNFSQRVVESSVGSEIAKQDIPAKVSRGSVDYRRRPRLDGFKLNLWAFGSGQVFDNVDDFCCGILHFQRGGLGPGWIFVWGWGSFASGGRCG